MDKQTVTVLLEEKEEKVNPDPPVVTINLKVKSKKKGVQWAENVIDNEDMNKKKSKKCCIYHKKREFGESSTESCTDSEGEGDHKECCN